MTDDAIVVTGIGVISPYGLGFAKLQAGLLNTQCRLERSTGFYPGFDGSVAAIRDLDSIEALPHFRPSRTDQLAVIAARDAVRSAGLQDPASLECGVVMATTVAGLTEIDLDAVQDPGGWYRNGGLAKAASYPAAHVADAVGEYLKIRGPRLAVTVACASGAISIGLAANMLRDGECKIALAGGSDALCAFTLSGFHSLQALDANPCRPFDMNRAGLNLGEGSAVLALETARDAAARQAPIFAVLRGFAMTNDAFHPTAPDEQGRGLAGCIRDAMQVAGVSPDEIGYVNAHGTGTPLNDIAETRAYQRAFAERSRPIPVSSTKSYFGHCLGAAGALEAAITIAAIRCGALWPTLRLEHPLESSSVDWVRGEPRREPLPIAMSVSAGFGGSNAALIFGQA